MNQVAYEAFEYLNDLRKNPAKAIQTLKDRLQYFRGNTLWFPEIPHGIATNEGPSAIKGQKCIEFLENSKPLQQFKWNDGLAKTAEDHGKDIGPKGIVAHIGTDGSSMVERIERRGQWLGTVGENIDFGSQTGQEIILSLMIDDGVQGRGHRNNLFNTEFQEIGIYFGEHKQYKYCCVMNFAKEFINGQKYEKEVPPDPFDYVARQVFDFLNTIRQNPQPAIAQLEEQLKYFKGKTLWMPGKKIGLTTVDGPEGVQECIDFLKTLKPMQKLVWAEELTKAAQDHARDIGAKGTIGHHGNDHSTMQQRIERYCEWEGKIGENIDFQNITGKNIILSLIVDDGVPARGHRKNCFNPEFNMVGIAVDNHKIHKYTCVMDFATSVSPKVSEELKNEDFSPLPKGCINKERETLVDIKGGKKTTTIKTTYTLTDGSKRIESKIITQC